MVKSKNKKHIFIIFSILLIGFLLRLKQLFPFESIDESTIGYWIWNLFNDPFPIHEYPMLFIYINYLLALLSKAALQFFGYIGSGAEFLQQEIGLNFIMEAGRILTAIIGTFLIYMVYKIGNDFYNKYVGISAALFVAVNKILILHSHIFKSDMLVALLMTICLYFVLKYIENPKQKIFFLSSFFYGVAVAAKYNAFPIIFLLIFAFIIVYREQNRKISLQSILYIPAGAALGFFISSPNWLVHPVAVFKTVTSFYLSANNVINSQWGKMPPSEMFLMFFKDFIKNYGLIIIIIFIIGTLLIIKFRDKTSITISIFMFSYIFFTCFTGFYGDRIGIPVYSAIALIAAKTIFYDLKNLKFFNKKRIKVLIPLLGIFVLFYGVINIKKNIMNFNLMNTTSKYNFAKTYRLNHNLIGDKHIFGSQVRTPRIHKDIRISRYFVKKKIRNKNRKVSFVQFDKEVYMQFHNDNIENPRMVNINEFIPFYEINKRKYQPWNCDIIYLYRISPQLKILSPESNIIKTKRMYYNNPDTSFYPLKNYEKNPFYGSTTNGFYSNWIYSKSKIEKIKVILISSTNISNIKLNINNKDLNINYNSKNKIKEIILSDINQKKYHYDYIYNLNIKTIRPFLEVFFVLEINPKTIDIKKNNIDIEKQDLKNKRANIPPLFSKEIYPNWIINHYKKTGVDLTLLNFLNTNTLYLNEKNSIDKIGTEFYPVEKGFYKIIIKGNKLINPIGFTKNIPVQIESFSNNKIEKTQNHLNPEITENIIDLYIKHEISFIKIKIPESAKYNYLINKIEIVPDYKKELK